MWSKKTWQKVFKNDILKFKTGGPVPAVKLIPVWWEDMGAGEILKGKAVRLQNMKKSGDKYLRNIILKHGTTVYKGITYGQVDVYSVLEAFGVVCPAAAHAVKKLLCPGIRGGKDAKQDIREAKDAVVRAFEMEEARTELAEALRIEEDIEEGA